MHSPAERERVIPPSCAQLSQWSEPGVSAPPSWWSQLLVHHKVDQRMRPSDQFDP